MCSWGAGGTTGEARSIALLDTYGLVCGYAVPTFGPVAPLWNGVSSRPNAAQHEHQGKPAIDGDKEQPGLGEVLDGVLGIAVALMCVLGTLAVSLFALSVIIVR